MFCFCYLFLLFVSLEATVGFLGPNSEHVYCLTHQESLHVWKVSEVSAKYMSILGSSTIEDNHSYITDKLNELLPWVLGEAASRITLIGTVPA